MAQSSWKNTFWQQASSNSSPYSFPCAGSRLLERTLLKAAEDPVIEDAVLHVQTNNDETISFYAKFGFQISQTIPGYYRKNRLNPPDAHILTKALHASEES